MKRKKKPQRGGGLKPAAQPPKLDQRPELSDYDWKFDAVAKEQPVACCFLEYARESVSIRNAVETAKTAFANQGIARPESVEREAFRSAANEAFSLLHRTGFNISFWVGLSFPNPWQSVDETERKRWPHVRPEIPTPEKIPPFRRSGGL